MADEMNLQQYDHIERILQSQPTVYAKGFLVYDAGDVHDIQTKLQGLPGAYFSVAEYKAVIDTQVAVLERDIDLRKATLYAGYRAEKEAGAKLSEAAIDAMIRADGGLGGMWRRMDRLQIASKLVYELLEALRLAARHLQVICGNQNAERQMAGRS